VAFDARGGFNYMIDELKVIPVANIYNDSIEREGYGDLVLNNSIEAWRNIFRIRKAFFERKFPRVKLNIRHS
jgi:hypothetical protein